MSPNVHLSIIRNNLLNHAQPYEGNLTNVELSFGAFSKFKYVFKVQEVVQGDVDASNTNKQDTCASVIPKLKTNFNFIGDQTGLFQAIHGKC